MRAKYWAARPRRNALHVWLQLPVLLSIVGGIVAHLALRRGDPAKARRCLYLGLALAAALIAVNVVLASQFCIRGTLYC